MCFEGKWLQNRLRAKKTELRSLLAVDIQGHQHGSFCIVPIAFIEIQGEQLKCGWMNISGIIMQLFRMQEIHHMESKYISSFLILLSLFLLVFV